MKCLAAIFQILICCLSFALNVVASPPCGSNITPEAAYERATAVFVGKVLSVTTLYNPATKLSGKTPYHEVKLEVEKSWKLIDRREVTIVTENIYQNTCGSFSKGETYLVYADRMNDNLFISSLSRTNRIADADEDLKVLGEARLPLQPGEFRSHNIILYGILVCVVSALVIGIFLFRLNKKSLRPV